MRDKCISTSWGKPSTSICHYQIHQSVPREPKLGVGTTKDETGSVWSSENMPLMSALNTAFLYPDKDNLFVPSAIHFEIVFLHPDRPAVVPCRVTEPQAIVSLHREVPPEEITANDTAVTYDPTRGFVLKNPSPKHQGVFYCKAVSKGVPQISTKYQLLYAEGEDTTIKRHSIMVIYTTGITCSHDALVQEYRPIFSSCHC